MAIRALFRQEIDWFGTAEATLADLPSKAVEWFVDDTDVVFGAIVHHESVLNWSFAVLGRDNRARFRMIYLEFGFVTCDDARRLLFAKMETALGTDQFS
jgi:hypothetical protein